MHMYAAALLASAAALAPSTTPRRRSRIYTAVAEPETTEKAVEPPKCPLNAEAQLLAARDAILRASNDGVTRQQLRTLLRRDGDLVPPDETWTGGIMQLYGACRPLARDLLRKIGEARDDKPSLREQRLDVSGVDGESLLVAEGESARNDASLFIQPSSEIQKTIESVCAAAGPRLVLTLNPQFRDVDDTLDFLAKKTGLLGSIGGFLGGKAAFTDSMDSLGFQETFSLQEFVVTGTQVRIFKAYPFGWRIFALSDRDDEPAISLGSSGETRPDYNVIAEVLEANKISPKIFRDVGRGKALVQGVIDVTYEDIVSGR